MSKLLRVLLIPMLLTAAVCVAEGEPALEPVLEPLLRTVDLDVGP